eukprot:CAMPEP_0206143478 /NCGR_PEP_ID=MMETSP1473-20131121/20726_1 /ASSEMBLY_ACC=CAM_ASM_001109 /TAXON_ID=1461547 /ORGANISM="Stichococcus sp, Strain RCC1054" /LENGTH=345 /DNA_ID=CAMNT_0053538905 /DNA_START=335 /DNA_END=1368 /DNA_ORIENTATION=-
MALQLRVNDLDSLEPIRCLFGTAAGQQASLGPQRAEQWGRLKQRLADHSAALFCGQQRLFLYMFLFKSKLCRRQPWEDRAEPLVPVSFETRPTAEELAAAVRRFLGCFMFSRFDHIQLLEDAGIWTEEDMDEDEDETDDDDTHMHGTRDAPNEWRDDEDEASMERKYAVVTYQAAPLAVMDALRLVAECGGYSLDELAPSIALARLATNQLPRCALLVGCLPGPLNTVKHHVVRRRSEGTTGHHPNTRPQGDFPLLQRELFALYGQVQHLFNAQAAYSEILARDVQVEASTQRCMRVESIADRRFVTFQAATSDGQDAAAFTPAAAPERLNVEMDPEVVALLQPG